MNELKIDWKQVKKILQLIAEEYNSQKVKTELKALEKEIKNINGGPSLIPKRTAEALAKSMKKEILGMLFQGEEALELSYMGSENLREKQNVLVKFRKACGMQK